MGAWIWIGQPRRDGAKAGQPEVGGGSSGTVSVSLEDDQNLVAGLGARRRVVEQMKKLMGISIEALSRVMRHQKGVVDDGGGKAARKHIGGAALMTGKQWRWRLELQRR